MVYVLAPVVAAIPAFMAFAVIPFGPAGNEVSIFGHRTALQLTDLPIAMLFILAVASVGIYGIVLARLVSSGSTVPAARRAALLRPDDLLRDRDGRRRSPRCSSTPVRCRPRRSSPQQDDRWYIVLLPVSFIIYIVTMVGETNRAPFDMPESEGDLVGGFNTEYSSIKFAMFMLAEYVNMVTVSAVATTLFLGGWRAPWPISTVWEGANHGWWPLLWFVVKVQLLLFFFIWLRGTAAPGPLRPVDEARLEGPHPGLAGLADAGRDRAGARNENYGFSDIALYIGGGVLVLLLLSFLVDMDRDKGGKGAEQPAERAAEAEAAFDPMAGGFPVPPMPGQQVPPVPRRRPRRARS